MEDSASDKEGLEGYERVEPESKWRPRRATSRQGESEGAKLDVDETEPWIAVFISWGRLSEEAEATIARSRGGVAATCGGTYSAHVLGARQQKAGLTATQPKECGLLLHISLLMFAKDCQHRLTLCITRLYL